MSKTINHLRRLRQIGDNYVPNTYSMKSLQIAFHGEIACLNRLRQRLFNRFVSADKLQSLFESLAQSDSGSSKLYFISNYSLTLSISLSLLSSVE